MEISDFAVMVLESRERGNKRNVGRRKLKMLSFAAHFGSTLA
jgi:hypothetical protein